MLNVEAVQSIILKALESVNEERSSAEQIPISLDTCLFGVDAVLDSLALVSVIVDVESAVSSASGQDVSLTDDRAMSQAVSPFKDVHTLTAYILLLQAESK